MLSRRTCKHSLVATYYSHILYSKNAKVAAECIFAYNCQPIRSPRWVRRIISKWVSSSHQCGALFNLLIYPQQQLLDSA